MTKEIQKWGMFEASQSMTVTGNPFDVEFGAEFSHGEQKVRIPGFYDGDGIYRVRFMPESEGHWKYQTFSNAQGFSSQAGSFECVTPEAGNHGPVRISNQYHFAHADGTAYVPVGTTCYVWNLQGDDLEEKTLHTLSSAPFNKMRMCVFPKRYTFNSNEPPSYPFPMKVSTIPTQNWSMEMVTSSFSSEPPQYWDFSQFNPEYFQHLEKRIADLQLQGIEADLIIFHPYDYNAWGFDRMPKEMNDRYLHYLVARLGAYRNLWWSFANEYDLFVGWSMADWDHVMQLVQKIDPYDHLRSIHNCLGFYDHTKPWVTHCSIQNWNMYRVQVWRKMYGKPVVIDECGYEGDINMLWGDLSAEKMMHRFWTGFVQGGYVGHGETYVNNREELWWSKGGELIGQSPARIAFLRSIFESAPELSPVEKMDGEFVNLLDQGGAGIFSRGSRLIDTIIPEGPWNSTAAGYHGDDYFIFYFGNHQPGFRYFNLPADRSFRVDVIDTWNMNIECFSEAASGYITVPMPTQKYMAIRIQANK